MKTLGYFSFDNVCLYINTLLIVNLTVLSLFHCTFHFESMASYFVKSYGIIFSYSNTIFWVYIREIYNFDFTGRTLNYIMNVEHGIVEDSFEFNHIFQSYLCCDQFKFCWNRKYGIAYNYFLVCQEYNKNLSNVY